MYYVLCNCDSKERVYQYSICDSKNGSIVGICALNAK